LFENNISTFFNFLNAHLPRIFIELPLSVAIFVTPKATMVSPMATSSLLKAIVMLLLLACVNAQMFGMDPYYGGGSYGGWGNDVSSNYGGGSGVASTWLLCGSFNCGRG
jgi:hypothetical protein